MTTNASGMHDIQIRRGLWCRYRQQALLWRGALLVCTTRRLGGVPAGVGSLYLHYVLQHLAPLLQLLAILALEDEDAVPTLGTI